jgi:hypothetical protein
MANWIVVVMVLFAVEIAIVYFFFPRPRGTNKLALAIDIEAIHAHSNIAPVAVGMVLGTTNGIILKQQRFTRRVDIPDGAIPDKDNHQDVHFKDIPIPKDASRRCWTEFWLKNPQNIQNLLTWNKTAGSIQQMGEDITEWINQLEQEYPTHNIVIVSDNPAFDVAAIDNLLWKTTDRLPIRYTTKEQYRSVDDPTEQMACLTFHVCKKIRALADTFSPHDHDPLSDARNIYSMWVNIRPYHDLCDKLSRLNPFGYF